MSRTNDFDFFKNPECRYYPCHKNISEINCLFCYCPLYNFPECGGVFRMNDRGIKDCSNCILPHDAETGYDFVIKKLL